MIPVYDTETHGNALGFTYPSPNDPVLQQLRKSAAITLADESSEIVKASIIIGYVHTLFTHDGNSVPSVNDPLTILTEAKAGKSFRCVEYSVLAHAIMWAYGISARIMNLKTSDVETREYGAGHVVLEFWSEDLQKWIMSDVQAGIFPESDWLLLSAFELGQAVHAGKKIEYSGVMNTRFDTDQPYGDEPSYTDWIREYLYFYDTPLHQTFEHKDRSKERIVMLVPQDVTPPKRFQNLFDMNVQYTHSVQDFYAKP